MLSELSKTGCFRHEMKNCGINNVKRGNIPKFSKPDDIVTPLRLLELFLDVLLNNIIASYTKL